MIVDQSESRTQSPNERRASRIPYQYFYDQDMRELTNYIDWLPYLTSMGFRGRNMITKLQEPEAVVELALAQEMLEDIIANENIKAHAVVGFFPIKRDGDTVHVFDPGARP